MVKTSLDVGTKMLAVNVFLAMVPGRFMERLAVNAVGVVGTRTRPGDLGRERYI